MALSQTTSRSGSRAGCSGSLRRLRGTDIALAEAFCGLAALLLAVTLISGGIRHLVLVVLAGVVVHGCAARASCGSFLSSSPGCGDAGDPPSRCTPLMQRARRLGAQASDLRRSAEACDEEAKSLERRLERAIARGKLETARTLVADTARAKHESRPVRPSFRSFILPCLPAPRFGPHDAEISRTVHRADPNLPPTSI